MKKAIIIIGGGYMQCPQIRWAKEIGLHVVVTDKKKDVPGASICDEFFNIDGSDIAAFLHLAESLGRKYELIGVYSGSDFGLVTVASVSEKLCLPSCSPESVSKALDKSVAKEIWLENGVSTPRGSTVNRFSQLISAIREFSLPLIVKPATSCGSQGVCSVWNKDELKQAYNLASKDSNLVIVEEIVVGRHIDVNGLFMQGKFVRCGLFDRFFSDPPFHYPTWGKQPSSLGIDEENNVYELVEKAARAIGIDNGPLKADVIYSDTGPYMIELSPRFHGDVSTSFVSMLSTEGSPIKAWFSYLAGESDPYRFIKTPRYTAGWIGLFPRSEGTLRSITGLEKAKMLDGISDIFVSVKEGDVLKKPMDNSSLCGFAWAKKDDATGLKEALFEVRETIGFNTSL